jgi:hypothetical protein
MIFQKESDFQSKFGVCFGVCLVYVPLFAWCMFVYVFYVHTAKRVGRNERTP